MASTPPPALQPPRGTSRWTILQP
ncbi:hypothetical protein EE612_017762 [Oryza sativa]|nr:hypothetical protein EE612_017762 [Oryza sativa]